MTPQTKSDKQDGGGTLWGQLDSNYRSIFIEEDGTGSVVWLPATRGVTPAFETKYTSSSQYHWTIVRPGGSDQQDSWLTSTHGGDKGREKGANPSLLDVV